MPKLDQKQAKQTRDAEGGAFPLIPDGMYIGTLMAVEVRPGTEYEYWSWQFGEITSVDDGEIHPGSLWENTSLSPDAAWKLQEVFAAFEVDPKTDTDELLGEKVQLAVGHRVIEKGARMGQEANDILSVLPLGSTDD